MGFQEYIVSLALGAYAPIDDSDEEMARLGSSLAVLLCYFLIKRFGQNR
jgi:hypothetical protein